jgi:hypothetical protein
MVASENLRIVADRSSQGAAANVPTALGILGTTFPPGKAKNYAFSTYGESTTFSGPAAGVSDSLTKVA